MTAYYNENDPYAAAWLQNLIDAGHIAPGDVDDRSIVDVSPDDLGGYTQCHFFAGIGGWSLALRLAGWQDDQPVWTGSPPCQDHSTAGAVWGVRKGLGGERGKLAFPWLDLVGSVRPGRVYFENVPGIKGRALAEVEGRLEGLGYRVSRSERTSASVAAPHQRRRVWVAANRDSERLQEPWGTEPQTAFSDPRRAAPGDVWVATPERACGFSDGFPARVAAIRAFGNAIDPWVAAEFIKATCKR